MSGIDWSKAPEWAGAVVESERGVQFWVSQFGGTSARQRVGSLYPEEDSRADMTADDHGWLLIENRPSPAWSGEGLPPVGTACQINGTVLQELQGHERSWRKVEIIAHTHFGGVDVAVGRDLECATLGWGTPAVFRPIRTPEQIAADERHEAVMRMSDIVGGIEKVPSWTDAIEALYDAGLRFSEQPK